MSASSEMNPVATLEKEQVARADSSDASCKNFDEPELETAGEAPVKRSWYRGTVWQTCIIGICSFLSPGVRAQ